jgi:hypothetical protein
MERHVLEQGDESPGGHERWHPRAPRVAGGRAASRAHQTTRAWATEFRPAARTLPRRPRYGLGFWLHETGDAVMLEGADAGVSFRTVHDPVRGRTHTVLSNTTGGAWPVTLRLDELLGL